MYIATTIPGSMGFRVRIPFRKFSLPSHTAILIPFILVIAAMLTVTVLYVSSMISKIIEIDAKIAIDMKRLPCNISLQDPLGFQNKFWCSRSL